MNPYLLAVLSLAGLWLINLSVCGFPLTKAFGKDDAFVRKTVSNANNLFYCLFGVAGVAIAQYWLAFFKWIVLGLYVLYGVIQLILVVISIFTQITNTFPIMWLVILSNTLSMVGDAIIIYLCWVVMFS